MNLKLLLLQITPDQYDKPLENMSDRVSMALDMLLRGMGTIFIVLALLWGILAIFSAILHHGKNQPATPKAVRPAPAKKTPAPKAAPAVAPVSAPTQPAEDTALIAAITAAVAAYLDQPTTSFRVVSFKRTGKKK